MSRFAKALLFGCNHWCAVGSSRGAAPPRKADSCSRSPCHLQSIGGLSDRVRLTRRRALFPSSSSLFRVTEQPYKIPYYAALLRLLHEQPDGEPSLGRQILEDIWKGFQTYVDQLAWRETRFCVRHCPCIPHLYAYRLLRYTSSLTLH